jgi:hypothetical protein
MRFRWLGQGPAVSVGVSWFVVDFFRFRFRLGFDEGCRTWDRSIDRAGLLALQHKAKGGGGEGLGVYGAGGRIYLAGGQLR